MNPFAKILDAEAASVTRLGNPSEDYGAHKRRMNAMATMTGMRGFSVPPLEPKTDAQGKTRGMRKRVARVAAMAKVSEVRAHEFMHSAAKRRAFPDQYPTPRPMTGFLATMKEAA